MPPSLPPSPWYWSEKCVDGYEHDDETTSCTPCPAGTYGKCDSASERCYCIGCDTNSEVQPWRGQTYCVLCNGDQNGIPVRCGDPEFIDVAEGYFRPAGIHPGLSLDQADVPCQSDSLTLTCPTNDTYIDLKRKPVMAVPCPWGRASCKGGTGHGDTSCADGHEGLFCATCKENWYRSSDKCRKCPENLGHATTITILFIALGVVVLGLMALYLRTASASPDGSHELLGDCFPTVARALARLPPSTHRQVSAPRPRARPTALPCPRSNLLYKVCLPPPFPWFSLQISATFKIGLGLVQCLSTLRSFTKVRWPRTFVVLIEAMNVVLIEAFAVVPAECIVGTCPQFEPMGWPASRGE